MERKKLLFIAEAVTLAHVARPLALALALDRQRYDIRLACADGYDFCFKNSGLTRVPIASIPGPQFLRALAAGRPLYSAATLAAYVEDDLRLLAEIRPDLVLGDFRLSLSVSARVAGVPYVGLTNAYWSAHAHQSYTVPRLPLTRLLPIPLANALFGLVRPLAFAAHTVPLNRVRRQYGLAPLGFDLRRIYTDADLSAYADIPELFPTDDLPANHAYLGPVIWSPPLAPPDWWDTLPTDLPLVYVTLGSSGQGQLLPLVLRALAPLPLTLMVATADKVTLDALAPNVHVAPYLPGEEAARRASLVVCNGGSPTSQQALAAGVPVLGIAGNLDQFLNMHGIVAAGAGALLRADRLQVPQLQRAAAALLGDERAARAARRIAGLFLQYKPGERLAALLAGLLG